MCESGFYVSSVSNFECKACTTNCFFYTNEGSGNCEVC